MSENSLHYFPVESFSGGFHFRGLVIYEHPQMVVLTGWHYEYREWVEGERPWRKQVAVPEYAPNPNVLFVYPKTAICHPVVAARLRQIIGQGTAI